MIEPELCEICGEELDEEFDKICGDCQAEKELEDRFESYKEDLD